MTDLIDYLPGFYQELREQLRADNERWGDTWRERGREGQELRFIVWMQGRFREFEKEGKPIPWLKVAGEAFIAWVRENMTDWRG